MGQGRLGLTGARGRDHSDGMMRTYRWIGVAALCGVVGCDGCALVLRWDAEDQEEGGSTWAWSSTSTSETGGGDSTLVALDTGASGDPSASAGTNSGASSSEGTDASSGSGGSTGVFEFCGDGVLDANEACDDGNFDDEDACPSWLGQCQAPAVCGDGFVWPDNGEECDDGDDAEYNGCDTSCKKTRYVFVTSEVMDGDLDGIAGADSKCQSLATNAGLPGAYRAWIAGEGALESPIDSWGVEAFSGAYVTPCGTAVTYGWNFTSLMGAIDCDENGLQAYLGDYAWTNVRGNGKRYNSSDNCEGWIFIYTFVKGGVGRVGQLDETWTQYTTRICDQLAHLYCFQVGD